MSDFMEQEKFKLYTNDGDFQTNQEDAEIKPFVDFMNGNTKTLIGELNNEKVTDLALSLHPDDGAFDDDFKVRYLHPTDEQVVHLGDVISHVPSLRTLILAADLSSEQSAKLAKYIANSNVSVVSFTFNNPTIIDGSFFKALSGKKMEYFSCWGKINESNIKSLDFAGLNLDGADFFQTEFTNEGFLALFENMYGSSLKEIGISESSFPDDTVEKISGSTLGKIDFSKTSLESIDFYHVNFDQDAIGNLNLEKSNVKILSIETDYLTHENLSNLSTCLQNSSVSDLHLGVKDFKSDELAFLKLQGTSVDTLSIIIQPMWAPEANGGYALKHLDLTDAPVVTLNLSFCELNDDNVSSLHLKGTNVEHLILDFNDISTKGINQLLEMVDGTSVRDISYTIKEPNLDIFGYEISHVSISIPHSNSDEASINFADEMSKPALFSDAISGGESGSIIAPIYTPQVFSEMPTPFEQIVF